MRIKKLELQGFKSFKDKTVIHFDAGITGIVGPNGCGKSNIVDGLMWVMGEMSAKHLRGASMEDVIFAGADGYAPMGFAEVSLTLENDGGPFPAKYLRHSEVMVTRRLHRSGESEYFVNRESARLKDIQEIFMDTGAGSKGFSIIAQGQIGKIVTSKPEERRVLIEEAAGITKFKVRKRESQRKLTATDQNLTRLQDIIGEQKRQLDSLQRQAQRAERYRKIKDELQEKDMWLASQSYLSIHEETEAAQKTFNEAQENEIEASSGMGQKEAELEEKRAKVTEAEAVVNQRQLEHQQKKDAVVTKENEVRELRFEIEQARRNKEMTGSILEQHTVRKDALEKDNLEVGTRLDATEEVYEQLQEEFSEKNLAFSTVQERIQEVDTELTEKRREMLTVSQSESHLEAKLNALDSQIIDVQGRQEHAVSVLQELEDKKVEFETHHKKVYQNLENERQLHLDLMNDVDNFKENLTAAQSQLEERREETQTFKDELNEVASRLYGLENLQSNFEGFQEGVKNVMLWQRQRMEMSPDGQVSASFQPVAEVVEVPQKYELAMEASLGNRLQLILSDNSESAMSALDYLKEEKNGRSSFFTNELNSHEVIQPDSTLSSEQGFEAHLSDVVNIPEKFQGQIAHFFNDIAIVDSIATAMRLKTTYKDKTYVTLDGDTITPDGVITGGSAESADSGVLKRRREIKELSQRREELAGKLSLSQATLEKLEKQVKSMEAEVEQAQKRSYEKEILLTELKKDLERSENELNNAVKACERQESEVSRETAQLSKMTDEQEDLQERVQEMKMRKMELETRVEELDNELRASKDGVEDQQREVTELRVELASKKQELDGLRSQMEMIRKSLTDVNSQLSEMSEESQKSTESLSSNQVLIEQAQVELERMIHETQVLESTLAEAKNDYEEIAASSRELEEYVSKNLHSLHDYKTQMSDAQLKLEQLKMKEQYLIDHVNEKYMLNLQETAVSYKDVEGDEKAFKKDVEDLKGKLKRIGEVNLSAIEEYDELVGRYEFLSQQYKDLQDAKEQLRKVIDRINRICTRRFKETFEQVNERFVKVFPVLFGGGEARLIMIENEDKGEMGIDIVAKPPGKKLQNVGLLSGGEKALTAVSLVFSIFLVKPSPFCLLDEVDAPLDDANVFRFNDLVKEMSKRSQIIVVTHNKHTMKVNNKIFGVTMQEKGVSKMVSVSLAEAQKTLEI